MNNNNNNKKTPQNPLKNPFLGFLMLSLIATIVLNVVLSSFTPSLETEIYYNEFIQMVEEDKVEEVQLTSEKIIIYPKTEESETTEPTGIFGLFIPASEPPVQTYYTGYINDPNLQTLLD